MKTSTSRESDQVYLTLEDTEVPEDSYSLKMIRSCPVDSLLPCSVFFFNGENRLRFNITGLASLSERFSDRPVRYGEIREILFTLRDICLKLPDYLLDSEELLLDPEDIFMSPGDNRVKICYVPGLAASQAGSGKLLAEFLLKHTDHSDNSAADLAYAFYDKVSDKNCILSASLQEILTSRKASGESLHTEQGHAEHASYEGAAEVHSSSSPGHDLAEEDAGDFAIFDRSPDPLPQKRLVKKASPRLKPQVPHTVRRKQEHDRKILVLLIIAAVALGGSAAIFFRMDAAQIGGIAFLSISVIWLIRQQQYKKGGDLQNIWSDEEEDMADDDTFYRSLLDEVYANDRDVRQSSPEKTDASSVQKSIRQPSGDDSPPHELLSLDPGRYNNIPLNRSVIVIGKNPHECDICLKADTISRVHAKIEKVGEDYYLTDLFSTNGTFLDGIRLEPNHAVPIPHGSEVSFARYRYTAP